MIQYHTSINPSINHKVNTFTFPGGEVGTNVGATVSEYPERVTHVWVDARLTNSEDFMNLVMATDALREQYNQAKFALMIPYIPYARQDRVCNVGEALSIRAFAKQLNALEYDLVQVFDPHSPVSTALIKNVTVMDQFEIFKDAKPSFGNYTIVAPDQGAVKKCEDFAKKVGAKGVISFTKTRDLATGKITSIKCLDEIKPEENYLVLDDICDGGRTFIELAAMFNDHGEGRFELMVTHGIFSKGVDCVAAHFDRIYTTNSFRDIDHPAVTTIDLF
ncbi:Ribose-phosphate pyrophosphokinase [compost metagenome]